MIRKPILIFFLMIVVIEYFHTGSILLAQNSTKDFQPKRVWMNIGTGPTNRTIILAVTASYSASNLVYSVRLSGFKEKNEKFIDDTKSSQLFQFREYALMMGYISRNDFLFFSVTGGISLIEGKEGLTNYAQDTYRLNSFIYPALSLELNFGYTPLRLVGVGITGYANLNKVDNIFGILISLQIGRMR